MGTSYNQDRAFTDTVHNNVALMKIYPQLGWVQDNIDPEQLLSMDINNGIDYVFKDEAGAIITVQERFREAKYQRYGDFTIRYRRDYNPDPSRHASEYSKMDADYFTYGITNSNNKLDPSSATDFIKFVVLNVKKIYEKIDSGLIVFRKSNSNFKESFISEGKIIAPILNNKDFSSNFVAIRIDNLIQLFGDEVYLIQKGYLD